MAPRILLALVIACGCGSRSTEVIDRDADVDVGDGPLDDGFDAPADAALPECPPYQKKCGGTCISISVDPNNCGNCGVTCGASEVCSAGGCATGCLAGFVACGGRCVDLKADSDHCNSCGFACAAGTGCVDGTCRAIDGATTTATCAGGGPPVVVDGVDADGECAGGIAETTFRWAVCSCGYLELHNPLLTDAYDSTAGPYTPGQLGGGVGVNGAFTNTGTTTIFGPLWSSASTGGVLTSNATTIRQDLQVGGPLNVSNPFTVGGDAFVVGDVTTSSTISITGDLHQPGGSGRTGSVSYANLVTQPVTVPTACDRCEAGDLLPIEGMVAAHRSPNNDNATIALDPDVLLIPNRPVRLELPCGRFYLRGINTNAPLVISTQGRTALFIDGEIATTAPITFAVGPAGELDVFVADKLTTSAKMTIGSPNYPALTRVYLGGVGTTLTLTNDVLIGGFVYLARGGFLSSNPLEVFGGIIAGVFRNDGSTTVHYDRQVLEAGDACPPKPPQCTSCADCGNQACNGGTCGACTSNADCCAPLSCSQGECVLIFQ